MSDNSYFEMISKASDDDIIRSLVQIRRKIKGTSDITFEEKTHLEMAIQWLQQISCAKRWRKQK